MTYDSTPVGQFFGILNKYLELLSVIRVLKYIDFGLGEQGGVVS